MSTILALDNVLEVRLYCSMGKQTSINTIHYQVTATTTSSITDQEASDYFDSHAHSLMKAWLPDVAKYLGVRSQVVAPARKPFVFSETNAGFGADATEPLPTQAALILDKLTADATVGARGRLFLPFWAEDNNDVTGIPTAGAIVLANLFALQMLVPQTIAGAVGTATMTPVIHSRKHSTNKPITAWKFAKLWGTHRSRSQINKPDNFTPDR